MLHCSVFQCWHHLRWFEILWPCSKILFPVRAVSVQFLVLLLRPSSLGAVLVRFIWDHLIFIWRFCGVEGFYPLSEQFQSSFRAVLVRFIWAHLILIWRFCGVEGFYPLSEQFQSISFDRSSFRAVSEQFWFDSFGLIWFLFEDFVELRDFTRFESSFSAVLEQFWFDSFGLLWLLYEELVELRESPRFQSSSSAIRIDNSVKILQQ